MRPSSRRFVRPRRVYSGPVPFSAFLRVLHPLTPELALWFSDGAGRYRESLSREHQNFSFDHNPLHLLFLLPLRFHPFPFHPPWLWTQLLRPLSLNLELPWLPSPIGWPPRTAPNRASSRAAWTSSRRTLAPKGLSSRKLATGTSSSSSKWTTARPRRRPPSPPSRSDSQTSPRSPRSSRYR